MHEALTPPPAVPRPDSRLKRDLRAALRKLKRLLRRVNPLRLLAHSGRKLRNALRRRHKIDYVLLTLPGLIPPLPEERPWYLELLAGPGPLSLWELERIFDRIAADPRPRGVVLSLRGLMMPLADLQTLRGLISRLRARGKRVICFAQSYDLGEYFVASAADAILLQPGGDVSVVGLRQQAVFLKDALDAVGVSLDVIAISPYKGAFDTLSRSEISPEAREQIEWLLDARYDLIVREIAAGRGMTTEAVRAMIDSAPYTDSAARGAGFVDAVVYEEDLHAYLEAEHLWLWQDAAGKLLLPQKKRPATDKRVAVLPINGLMIPGESADPPDVLPVPLPFAADARAGDLTVVRQARALMSDDEVGAVVLFIESGGGAVIAAEAMTGALAALAARKPLVAYMNAVAASGGYEVATPARWIVAQAGTITGSIGVVMAKAITAGLREKLRVHAEEFTRGANAGLYTDLAPFSEAQRAHVRAAIEHSYEQFVAKVARSRSLSPEAVDRVGGGRVWTGEQALERGLVDALGGLGDAIAKACELASLPDETPVELVSGKARPLPPLKPLVASEQIYDMLTYMTENARLIGSGRAQALLPFRLL